MSEEFYPVTESEEGTFTVHCDFVFTNGKGFRRGNVISEEFAQSIRESELYSHGMLDTPNLVPPEGAIDFEYGNTFLEGGERRLMEEHEAFKDALTQF